MNGTMRVCMENDMQTSQSYLAFTIEEQGYALPLHSVKKVIRAVELTRLPDSPPILKGLLNMHGEIIPVLNLRSRFGLPERDILFEDRIILCKLAEKVIAFGVDLVSGVVEVAPDKFDAAKKILPEMDSSVSGVGKTGNETILIYDLDKLFSLNDIRELKRKESLFARDAEVAC